MTIRNIQRASVLFLVSILTACGGGGLNDLSAQSIKLSIQNEAPLSACASGGVTLNSGVDTNHDLVLQSTEITGTQYICNANNGIAGWSGFNGLAGTSGLSALVVVSNELHGANCATGGTQVSAGFDTNQDKTLNALEVTSSNYICNGTNGSNGSSGNSGPDGTAGLNGINGAAGTNGATGNNGAAGATGAAGTNGLAGATGATGNNGLAGATGATGNNGAAGATGLAGTNGSIGATGATGATGSAGSDGAAGTDGRDGAAGAAGSNGTPGASGFKSLVAIVAELPGIHCVTGGVVAKSGVDNNSNNVLDSLEVTSTTYICNGERGATGATGGTGAQGETGATGPAGGGLSAYGYIYALNRQDVDIDAAVLFDAQSDLLNIKHQLDSSDISILQDGNYLVSFSITGTEKNQFAIFVNGAVVPGSIYGSGAGTQQNHGQVIVRLRENDTLTLVNYHSAAAVGLQSNSGGTEKNVVASVTLLKLNEVIR